MVQTARRGYVSKSTKGDGVGAGLHRQLREDGGDLVRQGVGQCPAYSLETARPPDALPWRTIYSMILH